MDDAKKKGNHRSANVRQRGVKMDNERDIPFSLAEERWEIEGKDEG